MIRGLLLAAVALGAPAAFAAPLAAPATVSVVATDGKVKLSRAKVPLGSVSFRVRNAGKHAHAFAVAGKRTKLVRPGRSTTLLVKLPRAGRVAYSWGTVEGKVAVERATTTVDVNEFEFGFELSRETVPAGKVTFDMRNTGAIVHNFDIIGVAVGQYLVSGQSASMTVTLKPGTYQYVCSVKYHAAQGMQGTLVVK
jgi:plastocyanin